MAVITTQNDGYILAITGSSPITFCSALRVQGRLWLYETGDMGFLWLCGSPVVGGAEGTQSGGGAPGGTDAPDRIRDMVLVEFSRLDRDTESR